MDPATLVVIGGLALIAFLGGNKSAPSSTPATPVLGTISQSALAGLAGAAEAAGNVASGVASSTRSTEPPPDPITGQAQTGNPAPVVPSDGGSTQTPTGNVDSNKASPTVGATATSPDGEIVIVGASQINPATGQAIPGTARTGGTGGGAGGGGQPIVTQILHSTAGSTSRDQARAIVETADQTGALY